MALRAPPRSLRGNAGMERKDPSIPAPSPVMASAGVVVAMPPASSPGTRLVAGMTTGPVASGADCEPDALAGTELFAATPSSCEFPGWDEANHPRRSARRWPTGLVRCARRSAPRRWVGCHCVVHSNGCPRPFHGSFCAGVHRTVGTTGSLQTIRSGAALGNGDRHINRVPRAASRGDCAPSDTFVTRDIRSTFGKSLTMR